MRSFIILALLLPVATFGYNWDCNLFCYNDGECAHGKGRFGSSANSDEVSPWEAKTHVDGMFCKCPRGFTGLQCEISLTGCRTEQNDFTTTCSNGSQCMRDKDINGRIWYHCECDKNTIFTSPYVNKFCEHISTVFCHHNPNDNTYASSQFCVNGGTCLPDLPDGTRQNGCTCPSGWEGKHCTEKSEGTLVEQGLDYVWNAATARNFGFFALFIVCATFAGLAVIKYRSGKQKKRLRREREEEAALGEGMFASRQSNYSRKSFALQESYPARPASTTNEPRLALTNGGSTRQII